MVSFPGSTATRVHVFSWLAQPASPATGLARATRLRTLGFLEVRPGLATVAQDAQARDIMRRLLDFARSKIPAQARAARGRKNKTLATKKEADFGNRQESAESASRRRVLARQCALHSARIAAQC